MREVCAVEIILSLSLHLLVYLIGNRARLSLAYVGMSAMLFDYVHGCPLIYSWTLTSAWPACPLITCYPSNVSTRHLPLYLSGGHSFPSQCVHLAFWLPVCFFPNPSPCKMDLFICKLMYIFLSNPACQAVSRRNQPRQGGSHHIKQAASSPKPRRTGDGSSRVGSTV